MYIHSFRNVFVDISINKCINALHDIYIGKNSIYLEKCNFFFRSCHFLFR